MVNLIGNVRFGWVAYDSLWCLFMNLFQEELILWRVLTSLHFSYYLIFIVIVIVYYYV